MAALAGLVAFTLGTAVSGAGPAGAVVLRTSPVVASATFAINLKVQVPGDAAVAWQADGQADFVHHSAQELVTVAPGGETLPANQSLKLEAKWVHDRAYVTLPADTFGPQGGQTESLPESTSALRQINLALTQSAVALTYARDLLVDISSDGTRHSVGTRRMAGTNVTGTNVDLTLAQLLKVNPGLSPAMGGLIGAFGDVKLRATVWVDRSGRLIEVALHPLTPNAAAAISGTIQYSHYNEALSITSPAAGTVKPMTSELQQLLSRLHLLNRIPLP